MSQIEIKKNKVIKKKTSTPAPAPDTEPQRSPTPPPPITINEEMTKFFEENPDDIDEEKLKGAIKSALMKGLAEGTVKKPKVSNKGISKAELKGYASTEEAEALGFFSAGDTCDNCGKVFNRKFFKAYHYISKDNQSCDGKVKRSNGKPVRPVAVKAKDWVASWSETAIEFGMITEPLAFTSKDINKFMCMGQECEGLQEALQHKPFRNKFAQYVKATKVKSSKRFEIDGETIGDWGEEEQTLWAVSKDLEVWETMCDEDSVIQQFVAEM